MKLDYKMLLNTAIGVAVGMVAYHFISKAMNGGSSSGETAGAFGSRTLWKECNCNGKTVLCGGFGIFNTCEKCCANEKNSYTL
jgi:hypothetical protein